MEACRNIYALSEAVLCMEDVAMSDHACTTRHG